jgi:hypothetical protein
LVKKPRVDLDGITEQLLEFLSVDMSQPSFSKDLKLQLMGRLTLWRELLHLLGILDRFQRLEYCLVYY